MTVARTRRPLPEPDNDHLNDQPANTTNDSINRSIELNQSFDIGPSPNRIKASQTTTVRMCSQRTAIENDSNQYNQSINRINTINRSIESGRAFDRADLS